MRSYRETRLSLGQDGVKVRDGLGRRSAREADPRPRLRGSAASSKSRRPRPCRWRRSRSRQSTCITCCVSFPAPGRSQGPAPGPPDRAGAWRTSPPGDGTLGPGRSLDERDLQGEGGPGRAGLGSGAGSPHSGDSCRSSIRWTSRYWGAACPASGSSAPGAFSAHPGADRLHGGELVAGRQLRLALAPQDPVDP